jgi:hypothetical protein
MQCGQGGRADDGAGGSGFRAPMYPYVALDTTKIHTPITLGIRDRVKLLVFELRRRPPRGFPQSRDRPLGKVVLEGLIRP